MKKILVLMLVLVALTCALASCGGQEQQTTPTNATTTTTQPIVDEPPVHEHSYNAEVTPPTCTEKGYTTHTCACGDFYVDSYVDAIGHDFVDGICTKCELKYSQGLEFTLNADGQSYSVTSIGTCTDTDIVIPETYEGLPVTSIGNVAFHSCSSLTSIEIPDSVTSIGSGAFAGCSKLESITLPFVGSSATATNSSSSTLFGYIFGTSSYTGGTSTRQYYNGSGYSTYYIPTSLKSVTITGGNILYGTFYGCSNLTSIVIGDSVTSIGEVVFAYCTSLTSIEIPDSVTSIGNYAFSSCTSLTSIEIPDSVTSIGSSAFDGCSSLTSIVIPNSVTSIGDWAFYNCSSLTSIVIPNSVTSIGNYAFKGCSSLTSIVIPDSVTSIGDYAFQSCTSLTSIEIHDSVTSIGDYAFNRCISLQFNEYDNACYLGNENNPYVALIKAKNTSITNCEINGATRFILNDAFEDCSSLTSIVIPDSVTSISEGVFAYCSSLTSIVIPDSVTSIGDWAFYNCSSLTIYCEATSKPSGWSFLWNYSNCPVVWGYKPE